ncbi:hypothetical protein D3C87_1098670 [compost metagenome]
MAAHRAVQDEPSQPTARLGQVGVGRQCDVTAASALDAVVGPIDRTTRCIEHRAARDHHVAAALNVDTAALAEGQARHVRRVDREVGPQAARVQHHALADRGDGRQLGRKRRGQAVDPTEVGGPSLEHVAQRNAAAARLQPRIDLHLCRMQRDVAAWRYLHGLAHREALLRVQAQRAELQAIEPAGVQVDVFVPGRAAHGDALRHRVFRVAQAFGPLVVCRRGPADDELRAVRHGCLRLPIAIEVPVACLRLAQALEGGVLDAALEYRLLRGDDQPPCVAPHRVAVLQPLRRGDQRVVEGVGHPPALVLRFEALVQARVAQIARRPRRFVEPAIGALEPSLANLAGLHVQRAA